MSRTATYHRALFEPILYARDATRGLSVLWAAARGDQAALRKAIRHGVTVNAKWPRKWRSPWKTTCHPKWRFDEKLKGYTALHVAAVFGRTDAAAILLSAGASTDELASVCWRCNLKETDALHDVTPRTATRTPLHFAVCYTNYDVAKELLRHGARIEVDGPHIRHWSALHDLSRIRLPSHATIDFADWIMNKCHADLELVNSRNKTPLATACEAGQFRLARKLLSKPSDFGYFPSQQRILPYLRVFLARSGSVSTFQDSYRHWDGVRTRHEMRPSPLTG
ncbi:Ankyrin repeat and protein kinase domain-containing protein 1 [Colletotrichum fructicola]|nr:Ankyrin repeat and protein kinase domain-containing protein 1 [Colletotrichum fructicola]